MANTELTKEMLFSFIAPIHIYHKADLMYKKEAMEGFRNLKKYKKHKLVQEYFKDDIDNLSIRSVNKVDYKVFWRVYDKLFKEIVLEWYPSLKPTYDYYGAKCFENENRKVYLDGDDYDCFPFYLDYESLNIRLIDLENELERY